MQRLKIRENFAWNLSGSLITSVCQWLMLIVITKILSPKDVGSYALALAVTAPIVLFASFQLRSVQVADAHNRHLFSDYLASRTVTNAGAFLIGFVFILFYRVEYDWKTAVVIFIILLNKIIEATSDICYGLMQKNERMDLIAKSMIVRQSGGVFLLSIFILTTKELFAGILAVTLWSILVLVAIDKKNVERFDFFSPNFKLNAIRPVLLLGLPLGIAKGLMTLRASIPRFFVEGYVGLEALGLFAAMAYVVVAVTRFVDSLGYAAAARLADQYDRSRRNYLLLLAKLLLFTGCLASFFIILSVFFGQTFLTIVYTEEYAKHLDVFICLMVVAGVTMINSILFQGMIAARRFNVQIPISFASCLINAASCYFLIPIYGIKGAAGAMAVTAFLTTLMSLWGITVAL